MKGLNRAEICDQNFTEFVQQWSGAVAAKPAPVLDAVSFKLLGMK